MTDQTRMTSLVEVCLGVSIGFCVSMLAWPLVGALYGIEYSAARHWGITGIFTALSVARGYIVRRFFARRLHEIAYNIVRRGRGQN